MGSGMQGQQYTRSKYTVPIQRAKYPVKGIKTAQVTIIYLYKYYLHGVVCLMNQDNAHRKRSIRLQLECVYH